MRSAEVTAAVARGAIASMAPDEEQWGKNAEADAVRLGLFALVPLKAFEPLAAGAQFSPFRQGLFGKADILVQLDLAGDRACLRGNQEGIAKLHGCGNARHLLGNPPQDERPEPEHENA